MADNEKKKCQDCYYWQGSCLCGDSKNYGKWIFVKACEYWCLHPEEKKETEQGQDEE
jgi:hypothetical protein